jgi:probable rRNA maturation factor
MQIELNYRSVEPVTELTKRLVSSWILDELKRHGADTPAAVELLIVDEPTIRELNRTYRHSGSITDVLSFSTTETIKREQLSMQYQQLGNIVLCWPVVMRQAKEHSHSVLKEAELLIRHSVQHLIGIHHFGDE